MIVKVKSENNQWNYFEGDSITQHSVDIKNNDVRGYPDTHSFIKAGTLINKPDEVCKLIGVRLCVQKDNRVVARIITNRTTYLMNDVGKTIERIN